VFASHDREFAEVAQHQRHCARREALLDRPGGAPAAEAAVSARRHLRRRRDQARCRAVELRGLSPYGKIMLLTWVSMVDLRSPMSLRLRRQCHKLLRELELPRSFSVGTLCTRLATYRGRPLYVQALPGVASLTGPCGVWLETDTEDFVFYESNTSRLHQDHIVLHEIGHMLRQHTATDLLPDSMFEGLFPDLDRSMVRRLLGRSSYSSWQEQEAETVAGILREASELGGVFRDGIGSADWAASVFGVYDH
jgi:hypothetical protein